MITSQACRQSTLADVAPGEIVAVKAADQTMFCLKIASTGLNEGPGIICLSPGHPQLDGAPGVFSQSVVGNDPVLHFPNAAVIPSPNLDHMVFRRETYWRLGTLLMIGDSTFIVAGTGYSRLAAWGTESGSGPAHALNDPKTIGFLSWEVVIEGPGGEPHTLFTVDAK